MARPVAAGTYEMTVAPATEPVTRAEAKLHARIDGTADDDLIDSLVVAARELVERLTGRALITQTWTLTMDAWPGSSGDDWWDGVREGPIGMAEADEVDIRKAPFIAISSVATIAESDGSATAWASSNYYAVKDPSGFGRLVKKSGVVWPLITAGNTRMRGGIVITFTAGYGAGASNVPMALRQAIKDLVAHWYENREASGEGRQNVPMKTAAIIQQYRVIR